MKKKESHSLNLCDICLKITSADRYDEVMHEIVKRAAGIFSLKGALIRLLDKKGTTLEVAAYYGLSDDYVNKGSILLDKSTIDSETILEGKIVLIKDAQKDKRLMYPEKVKKEGIRSILSLPLKTSTHTLGVLRCYTDGSHKFDDDEIGKIELLAEQAAVAIENLRALDRNKRILEISRIVNSSLDLSQVLSSTVKLVAETMKVKACTIRLLDERRHQMVLKAVWGLSDEFLKNGPYDLDSLPIDQQVLKDEIVYIPQVTKDSRFKMADAAEKEGIVSALCVPLKAIDRNVGTMRIYTAYEYKFTVDEENFLRTVADQAAIAVNNAILYERVHTLYLVSTSLSKSLDMHKVFRTIVEGATNALNAQGCSLFLWDPETREFTSGEFFGVSSDLVKLMKENYIDRSREIMCGEPVIDSHVSLELHHKTHKTGLKEGVNSIMNIPMKVKEHLTGIMQIYFAIEREFPPSEIEFFAALANEAAVAIENAKLYEHLNKKYNNLVEDIFLWYDGTSRGMDY